MTHCGSTVHVSFVALSFLNLEEIIFVRCKVGTGGRTCNRTLTAQPVSNNKHSTGFFLSFFLLIYKTGAGASKTWALEERGR